MVSLFFRLLVKKIMLETAEFLMLKGKRLDLMLKNKRKEQI